jgi:hypothetical protein
VCAEEEKEIEAGRVVSHVWGGRRRRVLRRRPSRRGRERLTPFRDRLPELEEEKMERTIRVSLQIS